MSALHFLFSFPNFQRTLLSFFMYGYEKEAYERSLKKFRDLNNVIDTAKIEGEKREQLATLKRLSALGRSIEVMMDATGLSEEEIRKLLES